MALSDNHPPMTDHATITRHSIETAYCFFHQKERVYAHSTLAWQRDDIEYAIAQYADAMSPALLQHLAGGDDGFLRRHDTFGHDLRRALQRLEAMMA